MKPTDTSLQDLTSTVSNNLTIIIGHIQFNRDSYLDGILQQMMLYDTNLIAAAAHSVLYSHPIGILGEWNNDYFEELWEYALASSHYEYGDNSFLDLNEWKDNMYSSGTLTLGVTPPQCTDLEKLVISNETHIKNYAKHLLLQYQNYLFSSFHSYYQYYNEIAKQGGYVFSGTNYSLITFGNHNDPYFDRYCTYTVGALPIGQHSGIGITNIENNAPVPYYITVR